MSIFNIFNKKNIQKEQSYMLNNDDWNLLAQMLYSQINSGPVINPLVTQSDYITKAYAYNPTVYSIISLRANAAKGVPWIVNKVKNKQKFREYTHINHKDVNLKKVLELKEQALEEVEGTPINKLIDDPNPEYSFSTLVEGLFTYRDTTGDAYLYAVTAGANEIAQLFLMPADKVRIVPGSFTMPIEAYTFEEIYGRKQLDRRNVMHWKYFNPIWDNLGRNLYGLSPLVAAARVINSDNSGLNHQNAAFANGGLEAILTGTDNEDLEYTKEQFESLRKKFKKASVRAQEGEGNMYFHRLPLEKIDIGKSPVDLGVLESQKYYKEVLCNIFRIHPSLLSSDASTLNNLMEARKALMTMSVLPDMDTLREGLNTLFSRFYGDEYFVDYDIMAIQELQDDLEKLVKTLGAMDWITLNEKRTATNFDRYDNGAADMLYGTMNEIPLGYGIDSGFTEIDDNLDKIRKQLIKN